MSIKQKKKIRINNSYKQIFKEIADRGIWFVLAFVLSFSSVVGGSCPFAVSLITVSSKKNFLFSAFGAGIGYILFCDSNNAIRYFSAVIIAALGTLAINLFNSRKEFYLPMIVSFLSVLSTGMVMNIRNEDVAGAYALTVGEAVLALGASFFFFRTAHCNLKRLKYKALPVTDTTCIMVSAAVVLTGLSFLEIKGVSPARIIAVLVILTAVRFGSQTWGLVISLCLGFALGISRENSMFLLGAYAFSALVSGLFTSISSLGIGISFSLSMVFFAVAADMGAFSVCCVIESVRMYVRK